MKKLFLMLFGMLSGCSVLGIPTTELYAGRFDSVEEFIANNFKPTLKLLLEEDVDPSGGVEWRAHFNGMNTMYLRKPVKDLRTYCSAKDGLLTQVDFENVEKARSALHDQRSPVSAYYLTGERALQSGESRVTAATRAWYAYEQQIKANQMISGYTQLSLDTLRAASDDGELGAFICEVDQKVIWSAVIEFVRLEVPKVRANGYEVPVAVLKIKGKTSSL